MSKRNKQVKNKQRKFEFFLIESTEPVEFVEYYFEHFSISKLLEVEF